MKLELLNKTTYANKDKLAEYFYKTAFTELVSNNYNYDEEKDDFINTYELREDRIDMYYLLYTDEGFVCFYINDEENTIVTMSCYTYEEHRGKGVMTKLLNHLNDLYEDLHIEIDTFDTSLIKIVKQIPDAVFFRVKIGQTSFEHYDYMISDILDYDEYIKSKEV